MSCPVPTSSLDLSINCSLTITRARFNKAWTMRQHVNRLIALKNVFLSDLFDKRKGHAITSEIIPPF